ncbi:MAG: SRPBCC family protein [Methanobacteriota archaeon]
MPAVEIRIRAPPEDVWRVVGQHWGDVHRIIPSLSSSRLLTDGPLGPGATRSCPLKEPLAGIREVEERVTEWVDGRSFSYVFDRPPWPMASITNRWSLEGAPHETVLTLAPSLRMRGGRFTQWLARPMLWFRSRSLARDVPAMAAAIEAECERSTETGPTP